jgi:beta-lactamase superfamily II metal-dependent hydrolase
MKNVGHGDCFVVLSDGRVVVIDAGPKGSSNGLVSTLRSGLLHYDRIVITHVHSDHAGGLLTAEQYARQTGSHLSTDLLVSNHGVHDLGLILNEERLPPLLRAMKGRVFALSDEGLATLKDPNLEMTIIRLPSPSGGSENRAGLAIKVTEIRDGERRAVLFLGDLEQPQQEQLFQQENAAEIFADVRAVTLPHHGRSTTLSPTFFADVTLSLQKLATDLRVTRPFQAQLCNATAHLGQPDLRSSLR